ncbi:aminopeptidase, partial [Faecalibacillus intestinalis]|uniref:aminopeptidase n=1 Tax=Faecalibacillus intestinalis TaxID=1982626 RepID=UPI00399351BF
MLDPRLKKMADTVIDYSLSIKAGERVMIETTKNCSDVLKYMIQKISGKGAIPFVLLNETDIKRELVKNGNEEQFKLMREHTENMLKNVDVYINMIDSDNCYDMSDVPSDKKALYQQHYFKPVYFEIIVPKLRWITVDYPSISSAQQFGMST